MGAVEHTELGGFERADVAGELRAADLPARARAGKLVLDHPLRERFGQHGGFVAEARQLFEPVAIGIGGGRHDPFDHRGRACAPRLHPFCKRRIDALQVRPEQSRKLRAIFGEIVARQQGQSITPLCHAAGKTFGQVIVNTTRSGQHRIEAAIGRAAIVLLGDRETDDPGVGRSNRDDHLVALLRCHQHLLHRTDQRHRRVIARSFGQRIKSVLRVHLIGHPGGPQRDNGDRPVLVSGVDRLVGIDRLVRVVERADAEVDDAAFLRIAIVAGPDNRDR